MRIRKNTESKNSNGRTRSGRIMFLSKCAVCNSEKSKFLKWKEAAGLLSCLVIRTLLSQISLLDALLL